MISCRARLLPALFGPTMTVRRPGSIVVPSLNTTRVNLYVYIQMSTPGLPDIRSQRTRGFLLQLINGVCQRLLVGLDVTPDVAVALVAGGLAGIVDAFLLGELA